MNFVETWALLGGLPSTEEQNMACFFLESKGLIFCVHYGYENAIQKAQHYPDWVTPGRA
jgi:hypothetical protein